MTQMCTLHYNHYTILLEIVQAEHINVKPTDSNRPELWQLSSMGQLVQDMAGRQL